MDPSKRNAAALHLRVDDLIQSLIQHYQTMLAHAREDAPSDYSRAAQKELAIKEESSALVTTAQNMAMLVRDLQELWLFGSLDTLTDPADEEEGRKKALEIAALVEILAKRPPGEYMEDGNAALEGET